MIAHTTIASLRAALLPLRRAGKSIGLVPTMGYLHVGHMELVKSSKAHCDITVVTIFVNPTQFAAGEDLSTYPRDLERDLAMLKAEGADFVFTPDVPEMYPGNAETIVETVKLSKVLMGKIRPGHFRGVATICTKLFNIASPDNAFFGEKDFQQVAVIKRMVADLNQPLEIVAVPTVREPDGLACSSRNVRLTPDDRKAAVVLSISLNRAGELIAGGERSIAAIRKSVRNTLKTEPRALIEAVDVRDAGTLKPVFGLFLKPIVMLLTVKFGSVRLIDNRVFVP
ncbi:MAG: pantoate--beta-alanine ligase [Rhizobiaceae bacterium]